MTETTKNRVAGILAFLAGMCWLLWAVVNTSSGHGLEHAAAGSTAATANSLLTAGWNLFLVPAALRLHGYTGNPKSRLIGAATIAGVLSLMLWSYGAFTCVSHNLETIYLALGALWLLALGFKVVQKLTVFGYFTLAVGAFTALDCVFNLLEPVPFEVYLLAAPKLPLCALWSLVVGVILFRNPRRLIV
jgi:hypothetical protein